MLGFGSVVLRVVGILTVGMLTVLPVSSEAGCGCDKPPPRASQILPNVAPAGAAVRILHGSFAAGQRYRVQFTAANGGKAADVQGSVVVRRDMADGQSKPQLVVPLPVLPIGPATVAVYDASNRLITQIADSQLTVAPTPIALPTTYGAGTYAGYQAAVGRDGTVYIALDLTGIEMPMVFDAQAKKYPLRFQGDDVVFYNTQGYLMQLLQQGSEPVPGMFVFPVAAGSADSDVLHYSRHEFVTYFLQHDERQAHDVDPNDGNWHQDGTPHIDHNGMILAIYGTLANGALPAAGATPAFDLVITTHSLFHEGVVGTSSVDVGTGAVVDSYAPLLGKNGVVGGVLGSGGVLGKDGVINGGGVWSTGDVFSAGPLTVAAKATIEGDVTGKSLSVATGAVVTGDRYLLKSNPTFMSFKKPTGLTSLGAIDFSLGVKTISGPGSFAVSKLNVAGLAQLVIDNTRGPVTLYVDGPVTLGGLASVLVVHRDPEQFAIYVTGSAPVTLAGKLTSSFYGTLYAPQSSVTIQAGAQFYGAFVGKTVSTTGTVHYYSPLRSLSPAFDAERS